MHDSDETVSAEDVDLIPANNIICSTKTGPSEKKLYLHPNVMTTAKHKKLSA